jgi:hypothetical protein
MRRYGAVLLNAVLLIGLTSCASQMASRQAPSTPAPVYTGSSQPGYIPAGTVIEVRTNEAINAESAAEGRTYSAQIVREIVGGNGSVLVPGGSPAQLAVVQVKEPGTVTSGNIELALRSITVNGRNYNVSSATVSEGGEGGLGANRRTATYVGGGAVLGTLIGAAAGGGKGAAIGAAVGAAAGAATQVLTKGKEVRVPAETVLTFRSDQPLQLQGYSAS